jgi:hypothetical protein
VLWLLFPGVRAEAISISRWIINVIDYASNILPFPLMSIVFYELPVDNFFCLALYLALRSRFETLPTSDWSYSRARWITSFRWRR